MNRKNIWILMLLFFGSLVLHAPFVIEGFGEQDAARLALNALEWKQSGSSNLNFTNYRCRTSLLYVQTIKMGLEYGIEPSMIVVLMNWSNMVAGALSLVFLCLIFQYFTNIKVALVACLLCSFAPAFWMAHLYGMPHMIALAFMLPAVWIFLIISQKPMTVFVVMGFGLIICLLWGVFSVKLDFILYCGIFPGLALLVPLRRIRTAVLGSLLPICALALLFVYQKCLISQSAANVDFVKNWSERFPFTISAITNIENITVLPATTGIIFFLAIAIATIVIFKQKKYNPILFTLIWAMPTILFWGLKQGNSSRHMMAAFLPFFLLAAMSIFFVFKSQRNIILGVIGIILVNYFVGLPPRRHTVRPSSRIFESVTLLQEAVHTLHDYGKEFFNLPYKQKIAVNRAYQPYIKWETLTSADSYTKDKEGYHLYKRDGTMQLCRFKYLPPGVNVFGPVNDWYCWTRQPGISVFNHSSGKMVRKEGDWF